MSSMYNSAEDLKVASIVETVRLEVSDIGYSALITVHDYWDRVRG